MSRAAKVALLGAVMLRPCAWDASAEEWSRLIPHDWPGDHVSELREAVTRGEAKAVQIETERGAVGFVVYYVDASFPRPELVLMAAYGRDRLDLTAELLPQLETLAGRLGCASVRFHTMRPGLVAKAQAAGFHVSEVILRKAVA
jgi:hypothetical protein